MVKIGFDFDKYLDINSPKPKFPLFVCEGEIVGLSCLAHEPMF